MNYNKLNLSQIREVASFVEALFAGIFRHDGRTPYFNHCEAVAQLAGDMVQSYNASQEYGMKDRIFVNDVILVGYLHDAVEDEKTIPEVIANKYGVHISKYVDILTQKDDESYDEYFARVFNMNTPDICKIVKLADLEDNINTKSVKQLNKYILAIDTILKNAATNYMDAYIFNALQNRKRMALKNKAILES